MKGLGVADDVEAGAPNRLPVWGVGFKLSNKPGAAVSGFFSPKVKPCAAGLSLEPLLAAAVAGGNSSVLLSAFGAPKEKGLGASPDGFALAKRFVVVLEDEGFACCAGLSKEKDCEGAEGPNNDGAFPEAGVSAAGLALGF